MRLSVVVPATDAPPTLGRCLDAIAAADPAPDETIVVDDPSLRGPAAARNDGVSRSTGEIVVFVDSDVIVHPDVFGIVRNAFEAEPALVAVFGSYDDRVETAGIVAGFRNLLHHQVHQRYPGPAQTFWAGLGAVRRDAYEAVGGFDAGRYPAPSIEDIELGTRLADEGLILLEPRLQGTHLKEWTLSSMVRTDLRARGIPWVRLILERGRVPATLNLGARERASGVAALLSAWALVRRKPGLLAGSAAAQVALNRDLYGLVSRRLGARGAAAALPLHVLHQLIGLASLPLGAIAHLTATGSEVPDRGGDLRHQHQHADEGALAKPGTDELAVEGDPLDAEGAP